MEEKYFEVGDLVKFLRTADNGATVPTLGLIVGINTDKEYVIQTPGLGKRFHWRLASEMELVTDVPS